MLITGRFGLQDVRHRRPGEPGPARRGRQRPARAPVRPRPSAARRARPARTGRTRTWTSTSDRKLAFLSRDPRAFGGSTRLRTTDVAGVYIVDAKDPGGPAADHVQAAADRPHDLVRQRLRVPLDGRPGERQSQRDDLGWAGGRPIIVTDLRDPANPSSYPNQPVDLFRQDGVTAYAHDVDVDDDGHRVGLRPRRHARLLDRRHAPRPAHRRGPRARRRSTRSRTRAAASRRRGREVNNPGGLMHNGLRPAGADLKHGPALGQGYKPGELVMGTEEDFNAHRRCDGEGQFTIASLEGSYDGEGWRSTPAGQVPAQDGRHVEPEGARRARSSSTTTAARRTTSTSQDGLIAYGLVRPGHADPGHLGPDEPDPGRLLPARRRQRLGVVLVRRLRDRRRQRARHRHPQARRSSGRAVAAPQFSGAIKRLVAKASRGLRADPQLGWMCPLPVR